MEKRVKGNYISFCVPIVQRTITSDGVSEEQYLPSEGDTINVRLVGYIAKGYEPTIDASGNLLFEDNGTLELGSYGLEVLITTAEGKHLRSYEPNVLCIVNSNNEADETSDNNAVELGATLYAYTSATGGAVDGMTEAQVKALLKSYATIASLSEYAKKTDIPAPYNDAELRAELAKKANTSDLPNDYLTQVDLQGYAKEIALNGKVDKINGKGLSTNDYTNEEKQKLETLQNYNDADIKARLQAIEAIDHSKFLTEHQSLAGYLTSTIASQTYQPKGNYLTEHQDISGKADKEQVVSMTEETTTIEPNKFYVWGIASDLDISLAEPTDAGVVNAYHFKFVAGENAMLALPADVIWQNNQEPKRTAGNTYEVSIIDNCASFLEFVPYDE